MKTIDRVFCFLIACEIVTIIFLVGRDHRIYQHKLRKGERTPKLADGCSSVYLDVGSNIGVQVRKLFEPTLYPNATVLPYFTKYFGEERRGNVCAFGFEANPLHEPRLRKLEKCYSGKGWRTKFIVPRVVSNTENETTEFFRDTSKDHNYWSSSIFSHRSTPEEGRVKVQSLDFAQFVEDHITGRLLPNNETVPGPVYVKLDVEGAEYQILGGLIRSGGLCHLTHASVEWHEKFLPQELREEARHVMEIVRRNSKLRERWFGNGCTPMTVDTMDDESYDTDGMPVPEGCEHF